MQVESLLGGGVYRREAQHEQAELASGTAELRRALARCQREWAVPVRPTPADADTLRAWGPYRSTQLDGVVGRYLVTLRGFAKKAALKKPAVS